MGRHNFHNDHRERRTDDGARWARLAALIGSGDDATANDGPDSIHALRPASAMRNARDSFRTPTPHNPEACET